MSDASPTLGPPILLFPLALLGFRVLIIHFSRGHLKDHTQQLEVQGVSILLLIALTGRLDPEKPPPREERRTTAIKRGTSTKLGHVCYVMM